MQVQGVQGLRLWCVTTEEKEERRGGCRFVDLSICRKIGYMRPFFTCNQQAIDTALQEGHLPPQWNGAVFYRNFLGIQPLPAGASKRNAQSK
ncbi:MAG: hypothetical protein C0424_01175 [Sphingobacteriaceae bacterium]|nr:hypothetical protein [Sphingobacteriaceae bacterium]